MGVRECRRFRRRFRAPLQSYALVRGNQPRLRECDQPGRRAAPFAGFHRPAAAAGRRSGDGVRASIVAAEELPGHFSATADPKRRAELEEAFRHVAHIPDVLRANVFDHNGTVFLSSDNRLVGRNLGRNDELEEALGGRLVFNSGVVRKQEHAGIETPFSGKGVAYFIEIYVPIRDEDANRVVGVVELYKAPDALSDAIHDVRRIVWASAILGGALLFAALFWIARRADSIMRHQQRRLLESETLALVGEMASAVAHAVRNPLAAIRSSAEMAVETGPSPDQAEDIVRAVDRVEGWVRELLGFSQPVSGQRLAIDANAVIRKCLQGFEADLAKRHVELIAQLQGELPPVRGDSALLGQVINSLVANAADAVGTQGRISVRSRVAARHAACRDRRRGQRRRHPGEPARHACSSRSSPPSRAGSAWACRWRSACWSVTAVP